MRIRRNPLDQRRRILKAAKRMFAQKGFARTNNDEIARAAGITRTLLYHYFQSKEDILNAIMLEALDQIDLLLKDVTTRGGSAAIQIRLLVNGYFDFMAAQPGLAELLVDQGAMALELKTPLYETRVTHLRQHLLEWVTSLAGSMSPSFDPDQFALIALGAIFFWFLPTPFGRALGADGANDQEAGDRYKKAVCDVLIGWIANSSRGSAP